MIWLRSQQRLQERRMRKDQQWQYNQMTKQQAWNQAVGGQTFGLPNEEPADEQNPQEEQGIIGAMRRYPCGRLAPLMKDRQKPCL